MNSEHEAYREQAEGMIADLRARVSHYEALLVSAKAEAWDEATASAYLHETEHWTGIKHAENPYRA